MYDSDIDELSSLDRLYVCLYDRFLVERDFGSARVSNLYSSFLCCGLETSLRTFFL